MHAIERTYMDPGNQVPASCALSMQSWSRWEPPRPPGAPCRSAVLCVSVQMSETEEVPEDVLDFALSMVGRGADGVDAASAMMA
jgi:hypothetical protein